MGSFLSKSYTARYLKSDSDKHLLKEERGVVSVEPGRPRVASREGHFQSVFWADAADPGHAISTSGTAAAASVMGCPAVNQVLDECLQGVHDEKLGLGH